jgi:hypothetical protein
MLTRGDFGFLSNGQLIRAVRGASLFDELKILS